MKDFIGLHGGPSSPSSQQSQRRRMVGGQRVYAVDDVDRYGRRGLAGDFHLGLAVDQAAQLGMDWTAEMDYRLSGVAKVFKNM